MPTGTPYQRITSQKALVFFNNPSNEMLTTHYDGVASVDKLTCDDFFVDAVLRNNRRIRCDLLPSVTCRSGLGVRRISSSSEFDAVVSAVDSLVLLHAVSARYRQSGALLSYFMCRPVRRSNVWLPYYSA